MPTARATAIRARRMGRCHSRPDGRAAKSTATARAYHQQPDGVDRRDSSPARDPAGRRVILRSDSQYVVNTMTRQWKRNANQELWRQLDAEAAQRKVDFEWVRGHGDDDSTNAPMRWRLRRQRRQTER